jgi:hypothetical protein
VAFVTALRRARTGVPLLLAALTTAGCASAPPPLEAAKPSAASPTEFVLEDPRIDESSGLAASRAHPGIFYTHNDMGAKPRVFAVSSETGETEAVLKLGSTSVDWEDIQVTDSGVWVGDIGGGDSERETVTVLTFPEPTSLADGSPKWTEYQLTYEDGPHNAEALLVDPATDQVYVVTKEAQGGVIYVAPEKLGEGENVLTQVAFAPPNVTGGSWAPDGPGFALRNYPRAFIYDSLNSRPRVIELPKSPRGESLVLLDDGDLMIGSEGARSEVVKVDVPSAP